MAWNRPSIIRGRTRANFDIWEATHNGIDAAHQQIDGRLSDATLNATYGLRFRGGAVAMGDSITAAESASPTEHAQVWWNLIGILTNQRIRFEGCFATAGFRIDEIAAVHLPAVLAMSPRPGACFIAAGTNNLGDYWNLEQMAADYNGILNALVNAGITPVLCTIPPFKGPTDRRQRVTIWNAWLRDRAARSGFPLVDHFAALVNPANGDYASTYDSGDGIHPSKSGHLRMAQAAAADQILLGRFPNAAPWLTASTPDGLDLLGGSGLFLTDSNADGAADGWLLNGVPTNATPSLIDDPTTQGKWQRLAKINGQTGTGQLYKDITTGFTPGDALYLAGRVRTSSAGANPILQAEFRNGTTAISKLGPMSNGILAQLDGMAYKRGVIPQGTTSIRVQIYAFGTATADCNVDFSRVTLANLTRAGLA